MDRLRTSLALIIVLISLIACDTSSRAVAHRDSPVTSQSAGSATVIVWVNTNSGIYHCPGTSGTGRQRAVNS